MLALCVILTNLSPAKIIDAIAANLSALYLPYGTLPNGIVRKEPDLTWFVSGIGEPWLNGVARSALGHAPEDRVAAILAELTAHNLPFLWHLGPTTTPAHLGAILSAQGLRQFADEPCTALDLRAQPVLPASPTGFAMARVGDAAALARWTGIWMATVPEPIKQRCRNVYAQLGLASTVPWHYYLGFLDDVPVPPANSSTPPGSYRCSML